MTPVDPTTVRPVDDVNIGTTLNLLAKPEAPMATCPRDDEPLVSAMEFRGAEFVCVVCGQTYGFLSPKPAVATPELEARHAELRARYKQERAERQAKS